MKYLIDLAIAGLTAWIIYSIIGLGSVYWEIYNIYEITLLYLIFILIPLLGDLYLSLVGYKKNVGFSKIISIFGIFVGIVAVVSYLVLIINAAVHS